jgi:shikimate kinase
MVFSTGGGVVLNKIILDYFKSAGAQVIFLDAQFETIASRLSGDASRPLFQNILQAKQMYDFRIPLYRQYADAVVDANRGTPDEIAERIGLNLCYN